MSIRFDQATSYHEAIKTLRDAGHTEIAHGDWAVVYAVGASEQVVRLTPYDPAFLLFAEVCEQVDHAYLPQILAVDRLSSHAFAVTMPRYEKGSQARREGFVDELQVALSGHSSDKAMLRLAKILSEASASATKSVPYFAGVDLNPDNVMFYDDTPVFLDALYQHGSQITDLLSKGSPVELNEREIDAFLQIPFHQ